MKILRSWLEEFGQIKLTNDELVLKLSDTGTEVESYTQKIDDNIICVEILKISKHPNADRLKIVSVTDGSNTHEVVCGASNIEVGQHVPLAKIGAKINGNVISRTSIREVVSNGMLCSEMELGIGNDHNGIKILSENNKIGEKINKQYALETVFDLEITPNRGDCLSHLGMAREIAAITGSVIRREPIKLVMDSKPANKEISVEIKSTKQCNKYFARVIKGIVIKQSPEWLITKLEKIGVKPINNIVDVTNYIMYDLGQPLHAFDAEKISNNKIIIRQAEKNEVITTLDDKERTLSSDNLVIADGQKPIAIAGVMGGKNSEITKETKNIVLEAAVFERRSVRRTARQLGIFSDASYRFERGIDDVGVEYAINKAANIIKQIAGGAILSGIVCDGSDFKPNKIAIEHSKINNLLGLKLSDLEINTFLKRLGFEIINTDCLIPSFRHDISIWQDLAEEVGRLYGYKNISLDKLPAHKISSVSQYYKIEGIKDELVNLGFVEAINYPFLSELDIKLIGANTDDLLEIANPVQPEYKYLRNNVINGLLKTISKNSVFNPVLLFEVGQVFTKKTEKSFLAVSVAGKDRKTSLDLINKSKEQLSKYLGMNIEVNVIEVDPERLKELKIRKSYCAYYEIDLSILNKVKPNKNRALTIQKKNIQYRPVSKYPSVTRDLAFTLHENVKYENIIQSIYNISENVNRVELFDEFKSDKLGNNMKSLAFHLYLQNMAKTLSDNEADEIINKIISKIEIDFKAKLRR